MQLLAQCVATNTAANVTNAQNIHIATHPHNILLHLYYTEKSKFVIENNGTPAELSEKAHKVCKELFNDMCTFKEVEQMAQRVKAAKLLIEGKTYNQVIEQTDISSATLSRVSRCVQYGNGYSKLLNKNENE